MSMKGVNIDLPGSQCRPPSVVQEEWALELVKTSEGKPTRAYTMVRRAIHPPNCCLAPAIETPSTSAKPITAQTEALLTPPEETRKDSINIPPPQQNSSNKNLDIIMIEDDENTSNNLSKKSEKTYGLRKRKRESANFDIVIDDNNFVLPKKRRGKSRLSSKKDLDVTFEPERQFQGKTYSRTNRIQKERDRIIIGPPESCYPPICPRTVYKTLAMTIVPKPPGTDQLLQRYRPILPAGPLPQQLLIAIPQPAPVMVVPQPSVSRRQNKRKRLTNEQNYNQNQPRVRFEGKTYSMYGKRRFLSKNTANDQIPEAKAILSPPKTQDNFQLQEDDDDIESRRKLIQLIPGQPIEQSNLSIQRKRNRQCRICNSEEDILRSLPYSIDLCGDCDRFLKRSLNYKWKSYKCKESGDCLIDEETRISCSSCRFQKFLNEGFTTEAFEAARRDGCQVCRLRKPNCSIRYGRLTCFRCAEFFRKTVVEQCETFEKCKYTRYGCKSFDTCAECRLKRCIDIGMTLSRNNDWVGKRKSIQQRFDTPAKLCRVCHKNRGYYQHGSYACQPCVAFFKRAKEILKNYTPFTCECKKKNEKDIGCASCRYRKCIFARLDLDLAPAFGLPEMTHPRIREMEALEKDAVALAFKFTKQAEIVQTKLEPKIVGKLYEEPLPNCFVCGMTSECPAAVVCRSCRNFFQETIRTCSWPQYQCFGGLGICSLILSENRDETTLCKYCRIKQCLAVGIKPEFDVVSVVGDNKFEENFFEEYQQILRWNEEQPECRVMSGEEQQQLAQIRRRLELCICGSCR